MTFVVDWVLKKIYIWLLKGHKFKRYGRIFVVVEDFSPHCDPDLEDRNPNFMTLKVMMIHKHTKFHYKRLSGSENIIGTNIPRGFEP